LKYPFILIYVKKAPFFAKNWLKNDNQLQKRLYLCTVEKTKG